MLAAHGRTYTGHRRLVPTARTLPRRSPITFISSAVLYLSNPRVASIARGEPAPFRAARRRLTLSLRQGVRARAALKRLPVTALNEAAQLGPRESVRICPAPLVAEENFTDRMIARIQRSVAPLAGCHLADLGR